MNRNRCLTILACVVLITLASGVVYAVSAEKQAAICARKNLPYYLNIIKPAYREFGLASNNQLGRAKLGEPIANVIIKPQQFTSTKAVAEQMKSGTFYIFPVLVEGEPVMDFTVVMDKGKWTPVDIGGHLSRIIAAVSTAKHLSLEDTRVLRFAGRTFILTKMDGKLVAYSPYLDYPEYGLKAQQLITETELQSILAAIQKTFLDRTPSKNGEKPYGTVEVSAALFPGQTVTSG